MDSNSRKNRVVGMKQVLRAVEKDALERVYLAADAQPSIRERVEAACLRNAVPVVAAPDMQTLGRRLRGRPQGRQQPLNHPGKRPENRCAEQEPAALIVLSDNHPYKWVAGSCKI